MKILIVNGPNLNLLGTREPDIYGSESFEDFLTSLQETFPEHTIDYKQSNVEGELIDFLQEAVDPYDAIVINPGGYSHTSVALSDCIAAIPTPVVEVHISNIYQRESYRHQSITGKNAQGIITGFGMPGYKLAIDYLLDFSM